MPNIQAQLVFAVPRITAMKRISIRKTNRIPPSRQKARPLIARN